MSGEHPAARGFAAWQDRRGFEYDAPELDAGGGNVPLDAAPGGELRVSHFSTCPDAARFRRRGRGQVER